MNDVYYETRYVAFLDILGFKNMVEQSTESQDILNQINDALNYTNKVQHDNYHGFLPQVEFGKQVTTFSDSIVISYNTSTPGGGFHVLLDLVHISINLLDIGILVRGGVTVGQLIHKEQKYFGPAINKAYNMELNEAIFPRIVIDENVLNFDLENPGPANTVKFEEKFLTDLIKTDSNDDNKLRLAITIKPKMLHIKLFHCLYIFIRHSGLLIFTFEFCPFLFKFLFFI